MAPASAPMDKDATQPTFDPSASTAYPRWVLFEHYGKDDKDSTADDGTMATAHTSSGDPIGVSLRLAPPPAVSSICVDFPLGLKDTYSSVVAAHGDSILIHVYLKKGYDDETGDYFVYNVSAASSEPPRPPSLWLLPPHYVTKEEMENYPSCQPRGPVRRYLDRECTGLLRRGEDEFAVAELKMEVVSYDEPMKYEAELFLLRSGQWSWSVNRPVATHCDDHQVGKELLSSWTTHSVLPVGDDHLCWVDLSHGLLFLNLFGSGDGESPVLQLQHVPLPVEAEELEPVSGPGSSRSMSVTAGGSTVRLVGVFPRCCCGGTGSTHCQRSLHAYTIRTWSLRMDDMVWEMDGMVDATELWALNAYEGLPRVPPVKPIVSLDDPIYHMLSVHGRPTVEYPILSMDDPNIICFLCEDKTKSIVMVDTRSNALVSVFHYPPGRGNPRGSRLFASKVSDYLNSYPSGNGGNHGSSSVMNTCTVSLEARITADDGTRNSVASLSTTRKFPAGPMQHVSEGVSAEGTILAALQEIPGLACEDMLKGYSLLSYDGSGRRFRALLGLPISLRKDWLLMEIKDSEACSACFACTAHLEHGS